MALPPLELFSLKEGAALLPGGSFRFMALHGRFVRTQIDSSPLVRISTHIPSPLRAIQARFIQSAGPDLVHSGMRREFRSSVEPGCQRDGGPEAMTFPRARFTAAALAFLAVP